MFKSIKSFFLENLKEVIVVLLILLTILIYFQVFSIDQSKLQVIFMDIGQGDSILIKSPSGNKVLVDGGPKNNLSKALSRNLYFWQRDIDILIVTNPDRDHFEGFIPLIDSYKIGLFIKPEVTALENPAYKDLTDKIKNKGIKTITALSGQKINIGGGAFIEIIFPDRVGIESISHNQGSIVSMLSYKDQKVLLTGDSTENIEKYLVLNYGQRLKADILKVAHHGSKTSSSDVFIKTVDPKWAVISAGKDNQFGHPHKEVLDRFKENNIEVLGTYDIGDIVFENSGGGFYRKK